MPSYNCKICDFTTSKKYDYNRHNLTQKHIHNTQYAISNPVSQSISRLTKKLAGQSANEKSNTICVTNFEYNCSICGEQFKHKSSLSRHKNKRCKKNVNILDNKYNDNIGKLVPSSQYKSYSSQDIIDMVKSHMTGEGTMETMLAELEQHNTNNTNNSINHSYNTNNTNNNTIGSINNNSNNNINNSFVVNAFGNENIAYITDKDMIGFCKTPRNMISKHLKRVHYDLDHPENHNIDMINKRNGDINIREDDGIIHYDNFSAVDTIVDNSYSAVTDFFDDKEKNDPQFIQDNMRKDEVKTYKKYVEIYDDERDIDKINNPELQPTYNDAKNKCLCVMIEGKINIKEFEKAKKIAEKTDKLNKRLAKKNQS